MTLHALVLADLAARGDKPALIDATSGRALSYAELDVLIRRMARRSSGAGA